MQKDKEAWYERTKKVEDKGVPMYVKKAYRGSEVIVPVFPNFGVRWRWVVSLTADCFTLGE